jgi:hypothetical protein
MTLKKDKHGVLFKTLCNNLVKFLSQQSSPDMVIYVCQAIRANVSIFRISMVVVTPNRSKRRSNWC